MRDWRFPLDENVDPKTVRYLEKEDIHAEHVRDALGQGTADDADVLPYAREHDLVVVTSDVTDFSGLPDEAHAGIVLLYDDTMATHRVASALIAMVDTYPNRDAFGGRDVLDDWA